MTKKGGHPEALPKDLVRKCSNILEDYSTKQYNTKWYNTNKYKMNSPFIFGKTVSKRAFTNRKAEIERLYGNLTQGINTIIISPRRWGKSSLVEKVMQQVRRKNQKIRPVIIDLFSVNGEKEFYEVLAREIIKASSTKWQDWLNAGKEFFKQLVPRLSVGVDPNSDFSLSFEWKQIEEHKDEILNLAETIAIKKNIEFIICLDEFQQLSTFKEYESLEKKMRAIWQRQKKVTYCLYGSKQHMMGELFNHSSKPFYRFGDILHLSKIEEKEWVSFIRKGFRETGKVISAEQASFIVQVMSAHSWYVQQLAHYVWLKSEKEVEDHTLNEALEELINTNSPLYQNTVEQLSRTQLNLLVAIAHGERKLTSKKVMDTYKLGTPRNVSKNRDVLIRSDIIYTEADAFLFLDPAFTHWFNKQFLKKRLPLFAE
jgi:hypothetical protein